MPASHHIDFAVPTSFTRKAWKMVPSTMSARPPCCSRLVSLTVHQHLQPHTRASEHRATNKETNATKVGEDKQPWPISLAPSRLSNAPCVAPRSSLRPRSVQATLPKTGRAKLKSAASRFLSSRRAAIRSASSKTPSLCPGYASRKQGAPR